MKVRDGMFVVIQVDRQEQKNAVTRLRSKLSSARMLVEPREVAGGRYLHLQLSGELKPADWEEVRDIVALHQGRVLLPQGLQMDFNIDKPSFPVFEQKVLLDTACSIIDRSNIPMYRRIVGLVDMQALHPGWLEKLVKHFSCIKILTSNPGAYQSEASRMEEEMGTPVLLGNHTGHLEGCAVVLAPSPTSLDGMALLQAPVLATGICWHKDGANSITSLRIKPPGHIKDLCPYGIDPHDFTAALCEFSGMELEDYTAVEMMHAYRIYHLDDISKLI